MNVAITKKFLFDAAQTLPSAPKGHKCRQMHGHSFRVEITVKGEVDRQTGWLYDHAVIGKAMKPILAQLDHSYLNEIPGLENPTIENMCIWFWEQLAPHLPGLHQIILHETPTAFCTYQGP